MLSKNIPDRLMRTISREDEDGWVTFIEAADRDRNSQGIVAAVYSDGWNKGDLKSSKRSVEAMADAIINSYNNDRRHEEGGSVSKYVDRLHGLMTKFQIRQEDQNLNISVEGHGIASQLVFETPSCKGVVQLFSNDSDWIVDGRMECLLPPTGSFSSVKSIIKDLLSVIDYMEIAVSELSDIKIPK